jgi:hypothetical protein
MSSRRAASDAIEPALALRRSLDLPATDDNHARAATPVLILIVAAFSP